MKDQRGTNEGPTADLMASTILNGAFLRFLLTNVLFTIFTF